MAVRGVRAVFVALASASVLLTTYQVPPVAADQVPPPTAPQEMSVPLADPAAPGGIAPQAAVPTLPNAAIPADAVTPQAGRRIVYSNSKQRVWAYDSDGSLVRTYLVSGRRGVPRPGEYRVFSRSPVSRSGNGAVSLRYMVRFARGRSLAIGFHEIPRRPNGTFIQTLGELGQFRSLGCVRQSPADADFLWKFAPLGTRVTVTA